MVELDKKSNELDTKYGLLKQGFLHESIEIFVGREGELFAFEF